MLSIVTDPDFDYIFVTEFYILNENLNRLVVQACRLSTTATTSTAAVTPTPTTSTTTTPRTYDMHKQ